MDFPDALLYNPGMVGLAVMRLQPLHEGHKVLLETMLESCGTGIVGIGSVQEARTERNPFTYEERVAMIRTLFPDESRLRVIALEDIGAPTKEAWAAYVLGRIAEADFPAPDRYFAGSEEDGTWFASVLPVTVVDRAGIGRGISATEIRRRVGAKEGLEGLIPPEIADWLRRMEWA